MEGESLYYIPICLFIVYIFKSFYKERKRDDVNYLNLIISSLH
nr:MAG TPA: hypothetical protein [Ackermannviridae sp.]